MRNRLLAIALHPLPSTTQYSFDWESSARRNFFRRFQLAERQERSLSHIYGVVAPVRLGNEILDPCRLRYRANAGTRDHSGSRRSWLHQYPRRLEFDLHLVRDSRPIEWNLDQMLLGIFDRLADRVGNFRRLADPDSDMPLAISDHYHAPEVETPSSLHHLCHAGDLDDTLTKLAETARIDPSYLF
jgi:hypothetical protein